MPNLNLSSDITDTEQQITTQGAISVTVTVDFTLSDEMKKALEKIAFVETFELPAGYPENELKKALDIIAARNKLIRQFQISIDPNDEQSIWMQLSAQKMVSTNPLIEAINRGILLEETLPTASNDNNLEQPSGNENKTSFRYT